MPDISASQSSFCCSCDAEVATCQCEWIPDNSDFEHTRSTSKETQPAQSTNCWSLNKPTADTHGVQHVDAFGQARYYSTVSQLCLSSSLHKRRTAHPVAPICNQCHDGSVCAQTCVKISTCKLSVCGKPAESVSFIETTGLFCKKLAGWVLTSSVCA